MLMSPCSVMVGPQSDASMISYPCHRVTDDLDSRLTSYGYQKDVTIGLDTFGKNFILAVVSRGASACF